VGRCCQCAGSVDPIFARTKTSITSFNIIVTRMDLREEDILEVVDADGGGGDAGDEEADGASEMADEEQTEEAMDDTPKVPRGPDTSFAQLRGHTSSVFAIAVSPDGALVATGGGDDVGIIWELATQAQVAVLRGHTDSVVAVAWNAAGTMLATGALDSSIRVWDRVGALLHTIEGPSAEIEWLSWHPKGDVLLAGRCGKAPQGEALCLQHGCGGANPSHDPHWCFLCSRL
jgi:WD40 repeat protein